MNIIRYDGCNSTDMILEIRDIFFRCSFCKNCGDYVYKNSNIDIISIMCLCDKRDQLFDNYKNFILDIPDDFSGDELEDFLEEGEKNKVQKVVLKHIYNMILFGMTYKKNYYNRVDENIKDKILSYLN